MKKTLLLSVVASTMIMAGGDIAPVEPVVETPAVAVASGWDFSGQAVVYYNTDDKGTNDIFNKASSKAAAGLQLSAVNKDLFAGIGAGVEVSGISDAYLFPEVVRGLMQSANNNINLNGANIAGTTDGEDLLNHNGNVDSGAEITQAYLTYATGNTSFKLGRQQLPKALSPFAFSEGWNVFKNTYDAALVVNTDIQDTTLVYAYVRAANNISALGNFTEINDRDGVHMLTVQNKSIADLTLTGSYYYLKAQGAGDDSNLFWADAKYTMGDYALAGQFGYVDTDVVAGDKNVIAFGAKVATKIAGFNTSVAYSNVNDSGAGLFNVGGVKTALYTQMIANQNAIRNDNDTIVVRAATKALGGNIGMALGYTMDNATGGEDYTEFDLTYKTKVYNDSTTLFAGYIYAQDDNLNNKNAANTFRVWGRYNF
jgi:hypothetical protein